MWRPAQRLLHDPIDLQRLARGLRALVEFSLAQAVSQVIGLVTGILVVRLLVVEQYALYTIANSMMSALYVLAESGVSSATVGIGGRVWQEPIKLGRAIRTALKLTSWLRNCSLAPIAAALVWLLLKNGATGLVLISILCLVLLGGSLSLYAQIYISVPRVLGDTRFQQAVNLLLPALRLVLTLVFATIGLAAPTAMLAVVVAGAVQVWVMRRWMQKRLPTDGATDPGVEAELRAVAVRQLPNGVYYLFQSQIGIWLLSLFATTQNVADLGAVTRISVILSVLIATMQGVVVPRYAREQSPGRLRALYILILASFAGLASVVVAAVWLAPAPLLWVLGPQYAHLPDELLLAAVGAALSSVSILAWMLSANRGWFLPVWINAPVGLTTQVVFVLTIGVSTVRQALLMTICVELMFLIVNAAAGAIFLRRYARRLRPAGHG